jgi:hypothetical protein
VTGFYWASFEVLTAVLMSIRPFLNVTPCKLVNTDFSKCVLPPCTCVYPVGLGVVLWQKCGKYQMSTLIFHFERKETELNGSAVLV